MAFPKTITTADLNSPEFDAETVRRYNAHDELVEALKSFLEASGGKSAPKYEYQRRIATTALAKAGIQ